MVGVLYTGLLSERRRELGLLLSVGMRPAQVVRLILAEAALTTGLGGVCGAILGAGGVLLFRRSLGFVFESNRVPFRLPAVPELVLVGVVAALICCGVGIVGAILPAWRAVRCEPYALIRGEGGG
jgi:putative ABC transport system permease protein